MQAFSTRSMFWFNYIGFILIISKSISFDFQESKKDPSLLEDYGKDPQFEEPIIDSLKEQKMKELDNLREILVKRRSQANQSIKIQVIN